MARLTKMRAVVPAHWAGTDLRALEPACWKISDDGDVAKTGHDRGDRLTQAFIMQCWPSWWGNAFRKRRIPRGSGCYPFSCLGIGTSIAAKFLLRFVD